ncbi:MAG: hypothetical protein J3R72DRAFT_524187 [Linnemannia gamsii]|nr:MAG: hypothetical protein J3R72DRAFT_524187 [Linnemannia gamsii]
MTYRGTINLDCIAADPYSRYLYGIGSANEGKSSKGGYTDSSVVLVRSNASPTNLTTLTLTVISQVKGKDFSYTYPTFTSVDCAGTSTYGWNSDMLIHKSFYSNPENTNAWHIITNDTIRQITLGSTTRQPGLFPTRPEWYPRFIAHHRDTFYISERYPGNASCPVFRTHEEGHLGEPCAFQGPISSDDVSIQHYVFGGERQGPTFFGGIYGVNNVLKMFTTEKQEGRKYLEHTLVHNNNASDMAVDRNFQVVGGLNPEQEPFVVALTTAGLYQFNIFGPAVGMMEGPFKVKIPNDFNSLPQRIATRLKIRKLDSLEQYQQNLTQEMAQRILEGSLSAFGVMLAVGLLVCDKENSNHLDEEERDHSSSEGKFEVYSRGIILEDESTPDHSKSWSDTEITAWTRPQLEGKILSDVHDVHLQDHNRVRELALSKHPRPTIVTSTSGDGTNNANDLAFD